ncbi:MAG TPA: competence/damage-inducible protein A [Bacillota bacterium]|nr:competence/damage-inducible protein A [Bacillota bacterium]
MKSSILSVGTELLFGQITNTNAVYLSQQLNLLGIDVLSHYTVGDNPDRLSRMIRQAFLDCDLIITTGGLGPTQDDLTKEVACEVLEDKMVLHEPSKERLANYFNKLNRPITDNNWKQAYFPSGATIFSNEAGTAPGFALEKNGKTIICLPGPPREMKYVFEKKVKPYLEEKHENVIYYRMLRMFGIGESALETKLIDLIDTQTDPTVATYAKEGECSLRIASKRKTLQEAKAAVDEMTEQVVIRVGEYIYSYDDEDLYQVVGRKLLQSGISISSAESCTGGLFSTTLTEIPGISSVFDRSLVTYSNRAKIDELGVDPEILEKHGAVSENTAIAMAEGLKKVSGSRLNISVTGIAGPEGGTEDKPVGLVYICTILDDDTVCKRTLIRNVDRRWNRNYTVMLMLDGINRMLDKRPQIEQ